MISDFIKWFIKPEIIGPILGVIFSVLIIEAILPWIRKKRVTAEEKLKNFYNVAYAFIKIREDFSVSINNEVHNKENCGFFHNFDFESSAEKRTGLVFDELLFFDYVSSNFRFIDEDLKIMFIDYFKARGPENIQNKLGCKSSKLIRLRREIENKIKHYYFKYKKEAN